MKQIQVGILGLGTVGAGTAETLIKQRELMRARTGVDVVLTKAADLDITTDRGVDFPEGVLTPDAKEVLEHPDIDVIVELIGGTGIAKTFTLQAFANKKSVVTANKALLAEFGDEIYAAAEANDVEIYYEASVAGGIPIIKALREGLVANSIDQIYGIMNGTCNYILTRMERDGVAFDDVLAEAQELGYAEADPTLDVDGWDTAHKAVLLARLAFGIPVQLNDLHVDGIRGIDAQDVSYADELGYRIKLLAILKQSDAGVSVSVEPALIPKGHLLSNVDMSFNAVFVHGDIVDDTMYYGRGAGRLPTASAVVADIIELGINLQHKDPQRLPLTWQQEPAPALIPANKQRSRSYLRVGLKDEAGTLATVTHVLGNYGISLQAVVQKENPNEHYFVPVVLLTGEALHEDLDAALAELADLDCVDANMVRFRLEELGG